MIDPLFLNQIPRSLRLQIERVFLGVGVGSGGFGGLLGGLLKSLTTMEEEEEEEEERDNFD